MSHLHLKSGLRSGFRLSTLALSVGMALMSTSGFALEALNDEGLAESTGEGIAFLPEDFRMVFQGANDTATQATDYLDRTKDTGYIRVIPVGPLTSEASLASAQKADVFLYGVAVSRADNNINSRYNSSSTGLIKSWGTADNPWLLKVQTDPAVPNFLGVSSPLSYLSVEAPEFNISGFSDQSKADYHLKLGFWADAFMRSSTVAAPDNNPSGWGAGLSNRLRLQAIWNDFSLNGSSINIFQTLGGATDAGGLSTSYNNTLGLSGTLRFNSGNSDGAVLRATISSDSQSRTYSPARTGTAQAPIDNWNAVKTPAAPAGGCDNNFGDLNCQYRFRDRTVTDTQTNVKWSLDPTIAAKALRLSTRGVAGEDTTTPAINGAAAPAFEATDGLFMYGANFNIVLGSLAQPLVIGVAADGRNLNMELTRIANQSSVYEKIYTDYANPNSTTYLGSTCNVYQCGRTLAGGGFAPATHSSISIGSTNYDNSSSKNLLTAYQQADAIGVSFGALPTSYNQNGTFSKTYNDVQYQQRQVQTANYVVTDRYRLSAIATTRDDPYNSPLGSYNGSGFNPDYAFRWYNVAATHNYWGYATEVDVNGNPVFADTGGRNLISNAFTINGGSTIYDDGCATAYACLGGKPMPGLGGYKDSNGNWVSGGSGTYGGTYAYSAFGENTALANMMAAMKAIYPGFVAGKDDCPSGASGEDDCTGRNSSLNGTVGVSVLNSGATSPTTAANASWDTGRTAAWLNAVNDRTATAVYNSIGTPKVDAIPNQISAVNASPLNNLGSVAIDGLLIQHMKITTKGL